GCVGAPSNHPIPCVRPLLTESLTPNLEPDDPHPSPPSPSCLSNSKLLFLPPIIGDAVRATVLPTSAAVAKNPLECSPDIRPFVSTTGTSSGWRSLVSRAVQRVRQSSMIS